MICKMLNVVVALLPSGVLLVTLDVISLCPSIPHDLCLHAPNYFLLDRSIPTNVVNGIQNMTELVLQQNVLESNSQHCLQTSGTAMGT